MSSYKIVVVGAGGVGKSSITIRMIQDFFVEDYDPTIEDSFKKQVDVDGEPVLLDIVDTAGQEGYESLRAPYIRAGEGFLLVYSIIDKKTFSEMKKFHEEIVYHKDTKDVALVVAGNMCDLESKRQVSKEEGEAVATGYGGTLIETSAKSGHNVQNVFFELVRKIRDKRSAVGGGKKKGKKCTVL